MPNLTSWLMNKCSPKKRFLTGKIKKK